MTMYYVADTYQKNATITNGSDYASVVRTCKWFNECNLSAYGDRNRYKVVDEFIKNPLTSL